jgi:hypothetical protein
MLHRYPAGVASQAVAGRRAPVRRVDHVASRGEVMAKLTAIKRAAYAISAVRVAKKRNQAGKLSTSDDKRIRRTAHEVVEKG